MVAVTCDGLTPALSVIPADRRTLSNWYVFVGPLVLAAISNVKTAESSSSFNRSSCLLRRSLMIQSRSRELQHGSSLAGDQPSDLYNLAVRKFKRVVMNVRIVHINLPKPCDPVIYTRLSEQVQGAVVLEVTVKHQLRAGKEADRHLGFANAGEAAGDRIRKISRYQLISDLSGARGDKMQTVIAHGGLLYSSNLPLREESLLRFIDLDQCQQTLPQVEK